MHDSGRAVKGTASRESAQRTLGLPRNEDVVDYGGIRNCQE